LGLFTTLPVHFAGLSANHRSEVDDGSQKSAYFKREASMKFRSIDCKACGSRVTLQTYTGQAILSRLDEVIECPKCGKTSTYRGDDFIDSGGAVH